MQNIILNYELLSMLVLKELKVRYKNSFLGYLWALANPFAYALVYYIAFKIIMRVDLPNYSIFLLAGMFPWMWLTNSIVHATASYRNNATLVKSVNLKRAILPLSNVVHEMVHFCFALPVFMLFLFFSGGELFISWIWQVPCMILLQLLLVYPIALIFAIINVFVHDVEYLVGIVLSLLFFLTPIVYPITMVPQNYLFYYEISPLSALMEMWRGVLLDGNIIVHNLFLLLTIAVIMIILAALVYNKAVSKIGEFL